VLLGFIAAAPDSSSMSDSALPLTNYKLDPPLGHRIFRSRIQITIIDHLDNYMALCKKLLKDELVVSKALEEPEDDHLLVISLNVFQYMEPRIIHCLIRGDLSSQYRTEWHAIDDFWRKRDAPSGLRNGLPAQLDTYTRYITDNDGVGYTSLNAPL
jgi:hypothetical protein